MDIHPLIAHFPIVLLLIGVVCDAIGILNDRDFFLRAGFLLFSLGALSALPVALTGDSAAEVAQHIDDIAADLDDHDTLGTVTDVSRCCSGADTHAFCFEERNLSGLFAMCISFSVLLPRGWCAAAGYTGGHLVYHYGAGTRSVTSQIEVGRSGYRGLIVFERK